MRALPEGSCSQSRCRANSQSRVERESGGFHRGGGYRERCVDGRLACVVDEVREEQTGGACGSSACNGELLRAWWLCRRVQGRKGRFVLDADALPGAEH